jgi:SNF2 family DNA or RNA helicase
MRVSEMMGRSYFELSGESKELTQWQDDDTGSVLGVQIQSGSLGVSMVRSRYAVFYSLGFSLGDYQQALARPHRPGQTRPVTYYHLVADGTVDQKVYKALQAKKNVIEAILEPYQKKAGVA